MDKFEFYIPDSETIPTRMRLKSGDKQIVYSRVDGEFAYNFDIYGIQDEEEGMAIVKQLAHEMCNQSYDHGAEWNTTGIEQVNGSKWKVSFRIRDSY